MHDLITIAEVLVAVVFVFIPALCLVGLIYEELKVDR
jgi:hypothetical protein